MNLTETKPKKLLPASSARLDKRKTFSYKGGADRSVGAAGKSARAT
jgi:hypothetical protein